MTRLATGLLTCALAAHAQVVISQVYGGGGNSGATYQNDFIELFNAGAGAVSLNGWSVQYASADGTTWSLTSLTNVSLLPGQYYLVQEAAGGGGTTSLPTPDAAGSIPLSAMAGKVALVAGQVALSGSCPAGGSILDLVGYGNTGCSETSPAPALSNTTALLRASNGCVDTSRNGADFSAGAPSPRNTASSPNACSGSGNPSGTGSAMPALVTAGNSTTLSAAVTSGVAVTCDLTQIGGSATFPLAPQTATTFSSAYTVPAATASNVYSLGGRATYPLASQGATMFSALYTAPAAMASNTYSLGGSATYPLAPQTATTFSSPYTVPAATVSKTYSLPCTVTDEQGRSGSFAISLTVSGGSTAPTATGSASPSSVQAGNLTTLSASVTSGTNPTSSGLAVTCNLSAIGGSSVFDLPSPGFSANYTVPGATAAGAYSLPCTVSDAQGRSSTFRISLTVTAPPPVLRKIYEITGSGTASPLAGQSVTVSAVVTAVRSTTGSGKGFYVESLAADRDTDANTSEGLLVFVGSASLPGCAAVGNYVQVSGTVSDFIPSTAPPGSVPLTELTGASNCQVLGTGMLGNLPAAVTIDNSGPATQPRKWLAMRVAMPTATVVGASFGNLTESTAQSTVTGEFFVTVPGVERPQRGVGILATRRPSAAPATIPSFNGNPEVLRVNTTALATAGSPYAVAVGSTVSGLSGVIDYNTSDGDYQLYTNTAGAGTPSPSTPSLSATPVPAPLATDLTIGSFNMERFYNDVADGNGAATLTTTAYQGRLAKASLAIRNVMRMPDILALEEVEGRRNGQPTDPHVVDAIAAKVNADAVAESQGNPNYAWCIGVTNDPGAINVAVLYKRGKVTLTDCTQYGVATQYREPDGGSNFLNDRPPLTFQGTVIAPGSDSSFSVRVVVNHLRSLNGIDEPGAGNGDQVRTKRNQQAIFLANLINGNWNTTDNLVVVGDFNAYHVNDGYVDVMNCIAGNPAPADQQYFTAAQLAVDSPCAPIVSPPLHLLTSMNPASYYSYVFSGAIQTLDHVLLNAMVYPRLRQLAYARNNAEFPEGPLYRNDFTRPERVSDHDMPVVYIRLPVEVSSRARVNASAVVLRRLTGRYTSKISMTNTGAVTLTGPMYVFVKDLPPGVSLPDLPQWDGVPYATIDLGSGLAPGATSGTVSLSFVNASGARISYATQVFDGSF